jgi:hypothetical protein
MALSIQAVRNTFGTSDRPYYAQASWTQSIDCERFIDRMAHARTTLSKTDIVAVFQLAREELASLLAEGYYVATPLGAAIPRASGTFAALDEQFRPDAEDSDHRLRIDFRLDPAIERQALAKLHCKRTPIEDTVSPRIVEVSSLQYDIEGTASPGDLLVLIGSRLSVDPSDESQGLFLRPIGAPSAESRCSVYAENRPARLVALLPGDLAPGEYELILRTLSRRGRRVEGHWSEKLSVDKA